MTGRRIDCTACTAHSCECSDPQSKLHPMPSPAPTSGANATAGSDIEANAASFGRHLRASNKAPATIHAYLDAVARLDAFLEARAMPRTVATIRREHVEAFIEDQLARL